MQSYLKQSTASQSRAIGPFLDDTDFKTPETALTINASDIKLVVNGAASANKNSGGGTHRVNGVYGITFDATDTATVGEMFVSVVVSGALPVFAAFVVLEEAVYDALMAASAPGYLQPTVAGRTLDVTATGEAGMDWANIGGPTTAVNLSGTTVKTATDVETDTQDIQSRLPAALVSGRIDASVGAMAANTVTATAIANDAITAAKIATNAIDADALAADAVAEIQSGLATAANLATVQSDTDDIQTRLPAALVGGRMDASVGAMAANVITSSALATSAVDEVVDGVWDEAIAGHVAAGSTGEALSNASAAGDPWATTIPGAYGAGTAGNIVGNMVDSVWDEVVDGATTGRQSMRLANSANGAKLSGAATATVSIRDLADSKDRVVATVDASGNRTAVTRDLT